MICEQIYLALCYLNGLYNFGQVDLGVMEMKDYFTLPRTGASRQDEI